MARLRVETGRITTPLHTPFVTALRRATSVRSVIVRLTDESGTHGYGEAPEVWRITGESMETVEACLRGPLGKVLAAWDPAAPPQELASAIQEAVVGNPGAKAACEIAATDLAARRQGTLLHQYLGAIQSSVRTDVTVAGDARPESTRRQLAAGFRHLKVKVGVDPGDVRRVCEIYERADASIRIRIDANQGWDLQTAVAAVDAWVGAGVDIEFLEQPLARWDLAGHAELRRRIAVPVMLDESVFSTRDLEMALEGQSCDLINVKLAKAGLHGGIALADAARQAGVGVMVGSMLESRVGVAAAAAVAATVAPEAVHDLDAAWWSIPPDSPVSPYDGNRFRLADSPDSCRPAPELEALDWQTCQ